MRSNAARAGLAVALLGLAIVLFVVLKDDRGDGNGGEAVPTNAATTGGSGAKPEKPAIPTIVIRHGKPVGGIRELDYQTGDEIRFKVVSDVADEIHVHGYDVSKDVEAGGSVSFAFGAEIEGVFEAELEDRKEQIIELRVNP